jgi:hypothetical protein
MRAVVGLLALAGVARAQCFHTRPTDPGGFGGYAYGTATVQSFAGTAVRVWYAVDGSSAVNLATTRTDGVPDYVALAASVTDDALGQYAAQGYRAPLGDGGYPACSSNGGDGLFDVYLVAMSGADGQTVAEQCRLQDSAQACVSYVLAASRLDLLYASADEGIRTVLPHETFHAVQNAYDAMLDRFWAEGTAQWAAKRLDPSLMDLERFLPAFFKSTSRSIDFPPGGVTSSYLYGAAIWAVFLTKRHPPVLIRQILEQEALAGLSALDATDSVLKTQGSSLAADFTLFAEWNATTGARADASGYPNAASYPQVTVAEATLDALPSDITSGLASFYYHLNAPNEVNLGINTDATRNAATLIPMTGGVPKLADARPLPATFAGDAIVVVNGITTLKTDAPFALTIIPQKMPAPPSGCAISGHPAPARTPLMLGLLLVAFVIGYRRLRRQ